MAISQLWQVSSARVSVFHADRGQEMIRETCPSTQIWVLLSGEWREAGDGSRRLIQPFEVRRYAPRQPCRRIVESESLAVSIELKWVQGRPIFSPEQLRLSWRITHQALRQGFEGLELEELLSGFEASADTPATSADWLRKATEIIRSEFRNPLTLSEIAGRVGISPNHLSISFRLAHGQPISRFLRRLRLEDSLRRLESEPAPWIDAGFFDASHFWRACRTDLGLSPRQIRELNRKSVQDFHAGEIK